MAGSLGAVILASASPRRAKILSALGVDFSVVKTAAEEVAYPLEPERTVRENALAKWRAAKAATAATHQDGAKILAADTIVWCDGKIFGKPRDLDEAREFLQRLSGRTHTVFTGVAFDGEVKIARSAVTFRKLDAAAIEEYLAKVRPLDRAGAYDIDEEGDILVERFEGEYENIMGLPLWPLREWGLIG